MAIPINKDTVFLLFLKNKDKLLKDLKTEPLPFVDWFEVSKNPKLTPEFIKTFQDYLHWGQISQFVPLSEDFIKQFYLRLYWPCICQYQILSESFITEMKNFFETIEQNMSLEFKTVLRYQAVSEQFILDNMDSIGFDEWNSLSFKQDLSVEFIKKNQNMINFLEMSRKTSEVPFEILKEFKDEFDWDYISMFGILSEETMDYFTDYIDWKTASGYQKMSQEFIEKNIENVDLGMALSKQKVSEEFIEKYIDKVDFDSLSKYQTLSEDFIRKYSDKVNWYNISEHQKLSEAFIEEFKEDASGKGICVDWDGISIFQEMSLEFIKRNCKYYTLKNIFANKNIPDQVKRQLQNDNTLVWWK